MTQPIDDLIVILNPHNFDYAEFIGTRAALEAEGLIPANAQWPEGFNGATWNAGDFHYWLRRERPDGAKGPRRAFLTVDWFCLRRTPQRERSDSQMRVALKKKELKDALYRASPQGRAEWDALWQRYWSAMEDRPFQAFKAACGIVEKKRGRPHNAEAKRGATA